MFAGLCDLTIYINCYMGKKARSICILFVLLFLSGCQSQSYKTVLVGLNDQDREGFQNLRQFEQEQIPFDYIADCKMRLRTVEEAYSGSCSIILTHTLAFQISVYNPLGGIVFKVYADGKTIQYQNFSDMTYKSLKNTKENRSDIPLIGDISIAELQSILWGRKTEAVQGKLNISFRDEKPYLVVKRIGFGEVSIRYLKWMKYQSLEFPKVFEIKNPGKNSSIKFAITSFNPGYARNLKIREF